MKKRNVRELNHRELQSGRTGEKYSLSAILSAEFGFKDLFVHHEIIPPGRRSSERHFHTRREEMVYIIDGNITAWIGDSRTDLRAGDYIGFPPGEGNSHYLENDTTFPAQVLVIASNPDQDRVEYVTEEFL